MRLNHTELMLDVSDSLSYSYVFISFARNSSDINRQKSTNIIKYTYIYILTIIHIFRFTKEVLVANQLLVATDSLTGAPSGALEEKTRPCPDVKSVKVLAFNIL